MANEVEVDLNSSAGAILRAMCAWAAPHTLVITDKELLKSMFTACRGLEASYFTASMLSDPAHAAVVAGMLADNDTKQELEKAGVPAGLRSRIVFTLTALASMQSTPPPTVSSKRSGTTAAGAAAGVDRKRSCQALIDTLRSTLGQPVLKDAGSKADVLKALEEVCIRGGNCLHCFSCLQASDCCACLLLFCCVAASCASLVDRTYPVCERIVYVLHSFPTARQQGAAGHHHGALGWSIAGGQGAAPGARGIARYRQAADQDRGHHPLAQPDEM